MPKPSDPRQWSFADYRHECSFPDSYTSKGRWAMLALEHVHPKLHDHIRGTWLDPFFRSQASTEFFEYVERNWYVDPEPIPISQNFELSR